MSQPFGKGTIAVHGKKFQARWYIQTLRGRQRKSQSFATLEEAEQFLLGVAQAQRAGTYEQPSDITVKEIVDGYLLRGASSWRSHTYGAYRERVRLQLYPMLGERRAESLTTPEVQRWIDQLIKEGYAPSTIQGVAVIVRAAFKQAKEIGFTSHNPVVGIRVPKVELKESTTWRPEHIAALLEAIDDPMYYALYRVMLATGMRPGEARALRWSDIDLARRTIHVQRTITRDENLLVIVGETTKSSRSRTISVSDEEITALRAWKVKQTEVRLKCPTPWDAGGYVFTRADGRWIAGSTWDERHKKYCAAAEVPYVTRHGMRHTNATLEMAAGVSAKVVAQRLGHRSITTTLERYSHVSEEMHREAAAALSKRLFGAFDAKKARS